MNADYDKYVRERVADSCAAQGIDVEPPAEVLELVAAVTASAARMVAHAH